MTWYNPGELTDNLTSHFLKGDTPERALHREVRSFIDAKEDPNEDGPEEELEDFLRALLDEVGKARHFFARLQIAAVYALAQAEKPSDG